MPSKHRMPHCRSGLSLVELVVSMGLLSLMMLPIIGLMATSYKVFNAGNTHRDGAYARQVAMDAIGVRLQGAAEVLRISPGYLEVRLSGGAAAELELAGGSLFWTEAGDRQMLATGITNARFTAGTSAGDSTSAGELVLVEVASQANSEPVEKWSSTTLWLRPTI